MGELEIAATHLLWPQKNPRLNHKMREGKGLAAETSKPLREEGRHRQREIWEGHRPSL